MVLTMKRWVGKVAIVTGASAGIGVDIVEQLLDNGVIVVGAARRVDRIEALIPKFKGKPGKLYAIKADMSIEKDILHLFEWTKANVGPVSILINNAGIIQDTNLIDGDTQKWKSIFDVNVLGLSIATREAVKTMRENKIDGHIIHISSVSGHMVNYFPFMNVYAASKHAVRALTETLRAELNTIGSKIKVTAISPGGVETEIAITNTIDLSSDKKREKDWHDRAVLASSDCADAVIYALSTSPICQVHDVIIKPIGEKF